MRKIEGTATISIEELDRLREGEQWYNSLRGTLKGIVANIDTEEYDKEMKKIDDSPDEISGEELNALIKQAARTVKIVLNENILRKLVIDFIDDTKSEIHYEISEMSTEEFKEIPLVIPSGQQSQGGQQEKKICEMCEAYMADAECDLADSCPAAGIAKRLKDAEATIKEKEKTIKERDKAIRDLKKKLNESELRRSYMVDPMAIGDRHEMGG